MSTAPTSMFVQANGLRFHVLRWGEPAPGRGVALLTHGGGLVAACMGGVARGLAHDYVLYAYDRRGHGRSDKPDPADPLAYDFPAFAGDLLALMEALSLAHPPGVLGVGHSAGGTDMLLAAGRQPGLFSRLFVMEPTVAHPAGPAPSDEQPSVRVDRIRRRRAEFPSRDALWERYRAADAFARWRPDLLRAYLAGGFDALPDGRVRLRCTPEHEAVMVEAIAHVMAHNRVLPGRPDPFSALEQIACPTTIARGERTAHAYARMVETALAAIPGARPHVFPGLTHHAPMEDPDAVVAAILAFVAEV